MGILWWIGIGLGIALLANWRMPPKNRNGTIITIASGILGAITGGLIIAGSSSESLASVNGASLIFAAASALLALTGVQLCKSMLYIAH